MSGSEEGLCWRRGGDVLGVLSNVRHRSVFSVCRKLVCHFPVCGWLRVVVAAIKQCATSVSLGWDDEVHDAALWSMLTETVARVTHDNPVRGNWCVDGKKFTVWRDASLPALGITFAVDEFIIEDACWLWPENDSRHINQAELDATLKGVNLAFQWQAMVLHIVTDFVCVHWWVTNALSGKARLTTRASSEMLIRRQLTTLVETIREYDLDAALVQSCQNHVDRLTRVPHKWLDLPKEGGELALANCTTLGGRLGPDQVAKVYCQSRHPGVNRTLYFARLVDPHVSKKDVRSIVRACETCWSIDPAPVHWKKGRLSVKSNWIRLAMDIAHHNGEHFLTLINCGTSTFVVWRPLCQQDATAVIRQLESVFFERGPPDRDTNWQWHHVYQWAAQKVYR